jgi:tetratricopeptide (TPR) repeat protein
MSKDNLVFALAGMIVGIIVGVLIAGQSRAPVNAEMQTSTQSPAPSTTAAPAENQLPEGHPPIDEGAVRKQIASQEEILKTQPNNQEAISSLGNLHFDLKEYQKAAGYYEKAVKNDPTNVNLITDLGSSYLWLGEYQKAIEYYNRSLSIDSKHLQTLMNLGIARMSMGDRPGAAEAWEKVIELYPDHPEVPMLKEAVKKLRSPQS